MSVPSSPLLMTNVFHPRSMPASAPSPATLPPIATLADVLVSAWNVNAGIGSERPVKALPKRYAEVFFHAGFL